MGTVNAFKLALVPATRCSLLAWQFWKVRERNNSREMIPFHKLQASYTSRRPMTAWS